MNDSEHNPQDQQLWRRLRPEPLLASRQSPEPEIDPNDLAAYLDGTADQGLVERIEARMGRDADLLAAVMELRQLRDEPLAAMTPRALRQASALVPEPAQVRRAQAASRGGPQETSLTAATRWWLGSRWAVAALLVLLACLGGYLLGQGTLASQQTSDRRNQSAALLDWSDRSGDAALGLNGGNDQEGVAQ